MGQLFDLLKQGLGSILAFFYDLLVPPLTEGNGLGISIILLTITINLIVFPLTLKQTRSTRAFTEIQPEIKRIQKEYKDDPAGDAEAVDGGAKGGGRHSGRLSAPALDPDADLVRPLPVVAKPVDPARERSAGPCRRPPDQPDLGIGSRSSRRDRQAVPGDEPQRQPEPGLCGQPRPPRSPT